MSLPWVIRILRRFLSRARGSIEVDSRISESISTLLVSGWCAAYLTEIHLVCPPWKFPLSQRDDTPGPPDGSCLPAAFSLCACITLNALDMISIHNLNFILTLLLLIPRQSDLLTSPHCSRVCGSHRARHPRLLSLFNALTLTEVLSPVSDSLLGACGKPRPETPSS